MAGIDKTYCNREQFFRAVDWIKSVGTVTLENGHTFNPMYWVEGYNDLNNIADDQEDFILWNTPVWFDRWLWKNCPVDFIRERLEEVYDKEDLMNFELWSWDEMVPEKRKYKFIEVPIGKYRKYLMSKGRRKNPWKGDKRLHYAINMYPYDYEKKKPIVLENLGYDSQTDTWGKDMFGMLPFREEYSWNEHHKGIPNKKAIIRLLSRWYIPKGTLVEIEQLRYYGLNFKILVE